MSNNNSSTNTKTKPNSNLFKALLRQGISRLDAEYLERAFSGPSMSSKLFTEGMDRIAEILVLKDSSFKPEDRPKVEPWKTIFQEMAQQGQNKSEDLSMAFSECLRSYDHDWDLQRAIRGSIEHRMGVIEELERQKGRNKQLLTEDYINTLEHDLGYSFRMMVLDD
jgi:hypothetical protein